MDSCYSGDHIAGDHIHMDITLCKIEETQQKYRLERSILDFWRGGGERVIGPNTSYF